MCVRERVEGAVYDVWLLIVSPTWAFYVSTSAGLLPAITEATALLFTVAISDTHRIGTLCSQLYLR